MQKVAVFVDGSNFYFGLKRNNLPSRVDYHELSKALAGPNRELFRTTYFNSAYDPETAPEQAKSQNSFYDSLRHTPKLDLRLGKLVEIQDGNFRPKGEKPLFAAELVYQSASRDFETAIVITDDPEYAPVLEMVKELGRSVEICLFKDTQPSDLLKASDRTISLTDVLAKFSKKIFPAAEPEPDPEDNIGNRMTDKKPTKAKTPKSKGLLGNLFQDS